ncbi:ketol-acid reductoisomerase, partial [Pseudomonas iridis]
APRHAKRNAQTRLQAGDYATMLISEGATGYPSMTAKRRNNAAHGIEIIGEQLRSMMPWIGANKIVDKAKN